MKIIQQNMLEIGSGVLFHQVNCQGIMGGGIAYALAKKFPGLEKAYRENIAMRVKNAKNDREFIGSYLTEDGDILCEDGLANDVMLGSTFLWTAPKPNLYIANVFGQGYVSSIHRMTSYDATVRAFEVLTKNDIIRNNPLYFPFKMGCGLGGGDWDIYSAIINRYFPDAIICQHEPKAQ
jgi:O-acetyl-ADP-ribose deacetylase (regulator of RNase III)